MVISVTHLNSLQPTTWFTMETETDNRLMRLSGSILMMWDQETKMLKIDVNRKSDHTEVLQFCSYHNPWSEEGIKSSRHTLNPDCLGEDSQIKEQSTCSRSSTNLSRFICRTMWVQEWPPKNTRYCIFFYVKYMIQSRARNSTLGVYGWI